MGSSTWVGIAIGVGITIGVLVALGIVFWLVEISKEKKYARESGWQRFPNGWFKVWPNRGRIEATGNGSALCRIMPVSAGYFFVEGFASKLYVMQFSDWLMEQSGLPANQTLTRDIVVARQSQYSPADGNR